MDEMHLRARLDSLESRLGTLEQDGDRFPSHGTRGSLSRPVVDGGVQPRDVHELNDVPADRDDDLMPFEDDGDESESITAGDTTGDHPGADQAEHGGDQAAGDQARRTAARRRSASKGSRQSRPAQKRNRRARR